MKRILRITLPAAVLLTIFWSAAPASARRSAPAQFSVNRGKIDASSFNLTLYGSVTCGPGSIDGGGFGGQVMESVNGGITFGDFGADLSQATGLFNPCDGVSHSWVVGPIGGFEGNCDEYGCPPPRAWGVGWALAQGNWNVCGSFGCQGGDFQQNFKISR